MARPAIVAAASAARTNCLLESCTIFPPFCDCRMRPSCLARYPVTAPSLAGLARAANFARTPRVWRGAGWRRCIRRAPGGPLRANGLCAPDVERLGRRSGDAHREIHETGLATLGDRHARPKRAFSLGGGQAYAGRTAEDRDGLAGKRRNAHQIGLVLGTPLTSPKAPLSGQRTRVTNAVPEMVNRGTPDDVTADCPIDILNIVIQKLRQLQREEP